MNSQDLQWEVMMSTETLSLPKAWRTRGNTEHWCLYYFNSTIIHLYIYIFILHTIIYIYICNTDMNYLSMFPLPKRMRQQEYMIVQRDHPALVALVVSCRPRVFIFQGVSFSSWMHCKKTVFFNWGHSGSETNMFSQDMVAIELLRFVGKTQHLIGAVVNFCWWRFGELRGSWRRHEFQPWNEEHVVVLIPSAGVMILFDHLVWTCFFNEAVLLGLAGVGIQPDPRHRYPMWSRLLIPINNRILVGGLEHLYFPAILGMSSSQLTNSIIFQRGRLNHHQN